MCSFQELGQSAQDAETTPLDQGHHMLFQLFRHLTRYELTNSPQRICFVHLLANKISAQ
jgi:hypothetical protein